MLIQFFFLILSPPKNTALFLQSNIIIIIKYVIRRICFFGFFLSQRTYKKRVCNSVKPISITSSYIYFTIPLHVVSFASSK